ncbi:MAG: stage V sporulation protein B [Clostridia bacterium]|nr:stage V sporulation protein B [Clostridia bacterium]
MRYGTILLTVTGLISQGLGFVYRIFLSRMIGAEVMGLYQLVMPIYSVLLSVTAIGLTAAVSHLTSKYQTLGNRKAALQTLSRCLVLFFLLLALPAAAVLLFSDQISVTVLGDARTQLGLIMLLPCLLLTGVENLHKHAFYGAGQVRPPAFTELLEQIVRTAAVLGLLVLFLPQNPERTVGLIVAGMVICEVFSSVTLTVLHRRRQRSFTGPIGPGETGRVLNRSIAHIAVPIGATALLGNLMNSACSILIPQKLVEGGMTVSESISSFGVVFGMTTPLLTLPTAFIAALGLVLVPKLAESTALQRKQDVHRRVSKAMLATSVLMLPAMAILVVLGPDLGAALFKEPTVGDHIPLLALGVALSCYQSVLSCALNGIGRQPTAARNALICGGVELVLVFFTVGIPGVGMGGYVMAAVVSSALGVVLGASSLYRAVGLKPRIFEWLTAPGLAALLMALVVNLLFRVLHDRGYSGMLPVLGCLVFGTVLYLCALAAQGVHAKELFCVSK